MVKTQSLWVQCLMEGRAWAVIVHLATTRHRGRTGCHWSKMRSQHHSRESEQAEWLECSNSEPGQDRDMRLSTKSHGPQKIKFLIDAVNDLLSPSNLLCWRKADSPACPLCFKTGTQEHIASSC